MATQDFNYVETDSAKIYTTIISSLMDYCNEALYPGDERRIFGEGLVQVLVGVFSEFNDKMKQRVLRHARGAVLDAIGERLDVYRLDPETATAVFRFTASAAQDAAMGEGSVCRWCSVIAAAAPAGRRSSITVTSKRIDRV